MQYYFLEITCSFISLRKGASKQLNIPERGIHAFRKTFNSNMRYSGVSEVVASALLGHSPQINREYYTYDKTSIQEKKTLFQRYMHVVEK